MGGVRVNRTDKRILAREHQKIEKREAKKQKNLMDWFHSWNPEQKEFHKNMVSAMLDEVNEITEKVLDSCFIASMIQTLDLDLEQCEEVAKQANLYMIEVKRIIEEKKEGYFDMLKDEKLRSEIKEEVKIIIKENAKINNLRIIDNLKENYKLPAKDFQIIIKEARKELEEAVMKELESSIDKEIPKYATGDIKAALANEGEHGFEMKLDAQGIKVNGLKIKAIEIEGKHGVYIKSEKGVKTVLTTYKDIADLEEYKKTTQEEIRADRERLNNKLSEIQNSLNHLDELEKDKIEEFAEIEAVFAM
jgi:hypothetical protein